MAEKQVKSKDEQKVAESYYILEFYNQVQAVNNQFSVYRVLGKRLDISYPPDKIPEEEQQQAKEQSDNMFYLANLAYISYLSIATEIKDENLEKVKDIFKNLEKQAVLRMDTIEEFTVLLNRFLMKNIVRNLLQRSQDYLADVFSTKDDSST